MSVDKSLISKNKLVRDRNVYNRYERLSILKNDGSWTEDNNSVFGLPKVKIQRLKRKAKKVKEAKPEDAKKEATK